ncbi:MAG: hypothetical protein AAGB93_09255 [Planctomycetota bacterium]
MSGPGATATTPARAPARAVGSLTRFVTARARQAHTARAACGGLASAGLVLACAVRNGASLGDPDALLLAVVVGSMAYLGWMLSRSVATAAIARRIDRELRLGGAFVAAYETERDRPESGVGQLGAARLLTRIRRSDALEAATPHAIGFLVLPMLALAALVAAVHAREEADRLASSGAARSIGLAAALEEIARQDATAMSDPGRADIEEIASQAARAAAAPSQEAHREAMADLADELDRLAREAPPGSDLAEQLARAAALAEAASIDLDAEEPQADSPSAESSADAAAQDEDHGVESGAEEGASGAEGSASSDSGAGGVERGPGREQAVGGNSEASIGADPGDRAAQPSDAASAAPTQARPGGAASTEEGVSASGPSDAVPAEDPAGTTPGTRTVGEVRWWAPRDDGLVRRWAARRETLPAGSK